MGEAEVTVEPPTEQPKPTTRRGRPKGSGKGAIKPEHIEMLTVQMFNLAAIIKQAPYWQVEDRSEVNYWTPAAAELANKYIDTKTAEKALEFNAAITVCVGIGIMVAKRAAADAEMRKRSRQQTPVQTNPNAHPQTPPQRATNTDNVRTIPTNRNGSGGGGATPTRPAEPLTGLGMEYGGIN